MFDVMHVKDEDIVYFQKNLRIMRVLLGKTCEEVGSWIGVTKQSISNLERHRVRMSKPQYIALRVVFECYVESLSDEQMKKALRTFISKS